MNYRDDISKLAERFGEAVMTAALAGGAVLTLVLLISALV